MKTNLPFLVRALLSIVILAAYIFLSADNRWDGMFNTGIIYIVAVLVSWFVNGISYNLFFGKKVIKETPVALRDTKSTTTEGDSQRSKAIGYYVMWAIVLGLILLFTIAKHVEIRGMQKAEKYWKDQKAKQ